MTAIRRRVLGVVVLVVLLAVLLVAFGGQFYGSSAYQNTANIDADYEAHVGEQVHLWGDIVAANEQRGVVFSTETLELTLTNVSPTAVDAGVRVQVYGELRPDRQMTVTRVVAARSGSRRWLYGVSVVGVGVATVAFLRQWRFDTDELAFVPREENDEISEGGVS